MNTPICDFVAAYKKKNTLRLHMPGHKGKTLLGFEELDITEIGGADVLYSPSGIIAESENNARELFGSGRTVYSAEGSSLSIRAMLYLAALWGESVGRERLVLAGRNAHRVFHSAVALLNIDVEWLYGEQNDLMSCHVTPEYLDGALTDGDKKPCAIYLTSPDYLGNVLDIAALSAVCRKHGVLCLVDNAHGAYLKFLKESQHPIDLGAHICADSAHKTLPALTGAAYLHIAEDAPKILSEQSNKAMTLFASTSPSYLILQSLDAVNKYLSEGYAGRLGDACHRIEKLKGSLTKAGYTLIGNEPLKITLKTKPYGYLGLELGELLCEQGIVCEFCDRDYLVLMLTPEITDGELGMLRDVLCGIEKKPNIAETAPVPSGGERVLSVGEALMAAGREISVEDSVGHVLADASVSCPPAVPIAVCGERITKEAAEAMKYYGVEKITVI